MGAEKEEKGDRRKVRQDVYVHKPMRSRYGGVEDYLDKRHRGDDVQVVKAGYVEGWESLHVYLIEFRRARKVRKTKN